MTKNHSQAIKELLATDDFRSMHFAKIGDWVAAHHDCGAGRAMKAFILSMFDGAKYRYSLSECLKPLDSERTSWVLFLINDYTTNGETPELCTLARKMLRLDWSLFSPMTV